jgi:hypothetical protein
MVQEEEAYAPPELEPPAPKGSAMIDPFAAADPFAGAPPSMSQTVTDTRGTAPSLDDARIASMKVQTKTIEVGDLFHYEIKNPVTVKRNQSALVPIVQGPFEGKRVAVYNNEIRDKNPMSAVLFKNTTGMTLEGGPVTVLEDDNYVGEAMLDTMKPAEERLVPYSVELGCIIAIDAKSEQLAVRTAQISHGWLRLSRYRLEKKIYRIENKTDRKLDLFLEHRFEKGWDLVDTERPYESTDNFYRFRMDVPPRKAHTFTVTERHDEQESRGLQSVDRETVAAWLEARYIDKATLAQLDKLVKQSERIRSLATGIQRRTMEHDEICRNQERLRKNLSALGATPDERSLRERYVASLAKDEDRIRELKDSLAKMTEEKESLDTTFAEHMEQVRFTVNL